MPMNSTSRSLARKRSSLIDAVFAGALVLGAIGSLSGCVAVVAGSAVGGGLMLADRRTGGAQIEDQSIELKSGSRVHDAIGDRGHVNVTSYNRVVLVTGEVPTDADKDSVGKAIAGIENVSNVVNELAVMGSSSLASRSSDTVLTGRVKTALIDAKDLQATAIKVVTERGIVYLMGRVTTQEADRAANIVRDVGGVLKVVRVFETITDEQLKALNGGK